MILTAFLLNSILKIISLTNTQTHIQKKKKKIYRKIKKFILFAFLLNVNFKNY